MRPVDLLYADIKLGTDIRLFVAGALASAVTVEVYEAIAGGDVPLVFVIVFAIMYASVMQRLTERLTEDEEGETE
jgi:hypothetical protein